MPSLGNGTLDPQGAQLRQSTPLIELDAKCKTPEEMGHNLPARSISSKERLPIMPPSGRFNEEISTTEYRIMKISVSEVQDIARLARLYISPADISQYREELSQVLELFDALAAVDTSTVEPIAHPMDVLLRLRPDTVTEFDQREKFQAIAPATDNGFYLVPRMID